MFEIRIRISSFFSFCKRLCHPLGEFVVDWCMAARSRIRTLNVQLFGHWEQNELVCKLAPHVMGSLSIESSTRYLPKLFIVEYLRLAVVGL